MGRREGARAAETRTDFGYELAQFVGHPSSAIFCVLHVPKTPRGGVLICSSILNDAILNYRREIELARSLAASGLAVARFDYRGSGHSGGDPLRMSQSSMREDAVEVMSVLNQVAGPTRALVGSRFGALVAAGLASEVPDGPMVFWEPSLRGESFFKEGFSASKVAHMTAGEQTAAPLDHLRSVGFVDVLGFPIGELLYDSMCDVELVETIGSGDRMILLHWSKTTLSPAESGAVSRLETLGHRLTVMSQGAPKAWWFIENKTSTSLEAVVPTSEWLAEQLKQDQ